MDFLDRVRKEFKVKNFIKKYISMQIFSKKNNKCTTAI